MVALSPRTCVELGIEFPKKTSKQPYVEVSGRKGLGVKADDLIDKLSRKRSKKWIRATPKRRRGTRASRERRSPLAPCAISC